MKYNILNTRDVSAIEDQLRKQYGYDAGLEFVFLRTNKDKLYVVSRGIADIDYGELNINSIGCYFGSIDSGGDIRLSIEGSQIVGPHASKNVVELTEDQFERWIQGESLQMDGDRDFKIVKCGDDYLTCGKIIDGELKNYVPKSRTIKNLL
jgi:NOL1/NOP2/fmu family ribosome biogenesis protein